MKLLAWVLGIVMLFAFLGQRDDQAPDSVVCGTTTRSYITADGVTVFEEFGVWGRRMIDEGSPEEAIKDAVDGMFRVLGVWFATGILSFRGVDLPPSIIKIREEAQTARAEANAGCTPCPQASMDEDDVPLDEDNGGTPPPVDSFQAAAYSSSKGGWSAEQRRIIAEAEAIRLERGLARRALDIITITGLVESEVANLSYGDADSIGWLQQRTSQGWGTLDQLARTSYQTRKFYDALVKVPNWKTREMGDVAQAVQISAYPDKYQKRVGDAESLIASLGNVPSAPPVTPDGDDPLEGDSEAPLLCLAPGETDVDGDGESDGGIIDTRIVWPTNSRQVGNGYGGHTGVDMNGPDNGLGDPFKAAASGKVTHTGPGKGYGNAVFVMTDLGYMTVYGHASKIDVVVGQRVTAGQQLGEIGYSGNVRPPGPDGSHLHFEARKSPNQLGTQQGSIDFLNGKWPNRNAKAQAAVAAGARKVKDPTSGVTYSIPIPAGPRGKAINFALDQLGEPYKWAAQGPNQWDCSGLTSKAWAAAGYDVYPQTEQMVKDLPHVKKPKPGDLLYKPGHVQMYLGKIQGETLIVEAPRTGLDVRIVKQWMPVSAVLDPTKMGQPA